VFLAQKVLFAMADGYGWSLLLPLQTAKFSCLGEFAVSPLEYLIFASGKLVVGRYVTNGAVEPHGIVMAYKLSGNAFGIFDVEGVLGRMHSCLRLLCQRSILPLLWG
jgi:hypothetical protein